MIGNLHTHSSFCDGADGLRELVETALEKGFDYLGFSGHSHVPGEEEWCMTPEATERYRAEIAALQREYAGRIRIFCGLEQDMDSPEAAVGYDYVIGSVHSLSPAGARISVDWTPEHLAAGVEQYWQGDWYAMCEDYYRQLMRVPEITGADILGHFDLVAKFNEGNRFFDEGHPRYVAAALRAADALLESGVLFEVNTGGMARLWRTEAYPAPFLRNYLRARGGRFLLSSDCHSAQDLDYAFSRYADWQEALPSRLEL